MKSMLDLNLNHSPSSSIHDPAESKHLQVFGMQITDYSATSNSSVVNVDTSSNAGDEEYSNQRYYEHHFNILKSSGDDHEHEESDNGCIRQGFTTKQFFPAPRFMDPVAEERVVVMQQQPQQVKKSRRGPRSKSSQYRGVTFYRRTGRWESHIWFAFSLPSVCVSVLDFLKSSNLATFVFFFFNFNFFDDLLCFLASTFLILYLYD